jgi:LPXTG-motif cell wall-anchored protein
MKLLRNQLASGFLCLLVSSVMMAQVQTEKTTTQGQPSVQTTVDRGEVLSVSGNDLVVKMEDGQVRNFDNVSESATVSVGGQQLSIHDLKPGMKLERTITTTTTPQIVTTVHTVTGRVWQVRPPNSVTLTMQDGSHQEFKIPEGQKFMVEGKETDAFGLRRGMEVSATKIVTAPMNVVAQKSTVTGEMPPPPPTAAIQGPLLIVVQTRPQPAPPAEVAEAKPPEAQPQPKKLPQTATELPLIALIGALLLLSGVASLLVRSRAY